MFYEPNFKNVHNIYKKTVCGNKHGDLDISVVIWCRSNEEMKEDTRDYFSRQKVGIEAEGYHIRGVISSHMDALGGTIITTQNFKLPNPLPVAPPRSIMSD